MAKAVKIERKALFEALSIVKDTIRPDAKNPSDPSNFIIIQDGRIHCVSSSFMVTIPLNIDLDCSLINVEFQLLYDYIRKLRTKEVVIGITNNGTFGVKASDSARAEFAISKDFGFDPENLIMAESEWKPLPETFVNALTFTAWATDSSDNRFSHVAICDGAMYGFSDKGRAACYDMKDVGKDCFPGVTFVHGDCLPFVNKYMGFDPARGAPKYTVNNSWLHLKTIDGVIMSSRTRADSNFDKNFIESMLEAGTSASFKFSKDVADILDRANPFSGKTAAVRRVSVYISNMLVTTTGNVPASDGFSWLELKAVREDGSRIYERCEIRRVQSPVKFTIGVPMLEQMLKYGETFRCDNRRLTSTGIMDNGRDDGIPTYRATVFLAADDED